MMSGRHRSKSCAKPITPNPIDLLMPCGVSEESSISMRSAISKPSSSTARTVIPCCADKCMPETTRRRSRAASFRIVSSSGR